MMNNKQLLRWALLICLAVAIGFAIYYREHFNVEVIEAWVDGAGILAPIVFMIVYAAATVLFLPGSVLTLAGGALFGPVLGTFFNLTGATLGASLAFLVARYLASDWVADKAGGKTKQLVAGVENEGWRFVAFVRLVPLFPFNLLNYALGLTKIRFLDYLLATYIFMLPGAFAYTYLGYVGREAAGGGDDLVKKVLIAIALIAIVAFLPKFIKSYKSSKEVEKQE